MASERHGARPPPPDYYGEALALTVRRLPRPEAELCAARWAELNEAIDTCLAYGITPRRIRAVIDDVVHRHYGCSLARLAQLAQLDESFRKSCRKAGHG